MAIDSILWRRLDQPGDESARLVFQNSYWRLSGTAIFGHHQQPCRLDYLVVCSSTWQTVSGRVAGWVGNETVEIELSVDSARRWFINGVACSEVAGGGGPFFCIIPAPHPLSNFPLRVCVRTVAQRR